MAKRFGMDFNAFSQKSQQQQQAEQSESTPEQVIPDNVGEYVDFEEVK